MLRRELTRPPFVVDDLVQVLVGLGMTAAHIHEDALKYIDLKVRHLHNPHLYEAPRAAAENASSENALIVLGGGGGGSSGQQNAIVPASSSSAGSSDQPPPPSNAKRKREDIIVASTEHMDREALVSMVVKLTEKLTENHKQEKALRKELKEKQQTLAIQDAKLKAQDGVIDRYSYFKQRKRAKKSQATRFYRRMSVAGMYRLGIRRCLGYASALSTAAMLDVPVSRHQVVKCENLFRSNIWSRCKSWYADMYSKLNKFTGTVKDGFEKCPEVFGHNKVISCEIHEIRGDVNPHWKLTAQFLRYVLNFSFRFRILYVIG